MATPFSDSTRGQKYWHLLRHFQGFYLLLQVQLQLLGKPILLMLMQLFSLVWQRTRPGLANMFGEHS